MWAAMMPATASAASCMSAKTAMSAWEACGGGMSFITACEMMPSVPSDWIMSPGRL